MFLLSVRPAGFSGSTANYTHKALPTKGRGILKKPPTKRKWPGYANSSLRVFRLTHYSGNRPVFLYFKVRLFGPSQHTNIAFHYLSAVRRAGLGVLGAWGGFGISSRSLCCSCLSAQLGEINISQPFTKKKKKKTTFLQSAWVISKATCCLTSTEDYCKRSQRPPASSWSPWWWPKTKQNHLSRKVLTMEAILLVFVLYRNWVSETLGEFSTSLS